MKKLTTLFFLLSCALIAGCNNEPTAGDKIRDVGDGIGDAVDSVGDEIDDVKDDLDDE